MESRAFIHLSTIFSCAKGKPHNPFILIWIVHAAALLGLQAHAGLATHPRFLQHALLPAQFDPATPCLLAAAVVEVVVADLDLDLQDIGTQSRSSQQPVVVALFLL